MAATSWLETTGQPIVWSPSGEYFFFVTRYGDLDRDCNQYELRVFATDNVLRNLKDKGPLKNAVMWPTSGFAFCSNTNDAGVGQARWDAHGNSIVFIGSDVGHVGRRLFRIAAQSGDIIPLSNVPAGMLNFSLEGPSVVFTTINTVPLTILNQYPTVEVPVNANLSSLLRDPMTTRGGVWISYEGSGPEPIFTWTDAPSRGPWLSPRGDKAILLAKPDDLATAKKWQAYDRLAGLDFEREAGLSFEERGRMARFMLIDMATGRAEPLFDAPSGEATTMGQHDLHGVLDGAAIRVPRPNVLWSPDGAHAILVNSALPLSGEWSERKNSAYIVSVNMRTGDWQALQPLMTLETASPHAEPILWYVREVKWTKEGQLLVSHHSNGNESAGAAIYALDGGRWTQVRLAASVLKILESKDQNNSTPEKLSVRLREGANQPPTVIASNGKQELALLGPDPALSGLWRARAKTVEWTETGGRRAQGLLLLPRGFKYGQPVPLVIQAYYYLPDLFRPDGPFPTAYAAQPLASRGMAVLQLAIPDVHEGADTPAEGPFFVRRLDSAVERLAADGIVDPARVGLVGFSRGGFMTTYAITHPGRTRLAAAINADGWTASYVSYLLLAVSEESRMPYLVKYEQQYGRCKFWENEVAWLEHETSFNADRTQTPLLLTEHGDPRRAILNKFDIVAAFKLSNKPIEFVLFPKGGHQLVRPQQRAASLQLTVDWMAFWLLGEENRNPDYASRNVRWHHMRNQSRSYPVGGSDGRGDTASCQ